MPTWRFWKRKRTVTLDEHGGTIEGALVIVGEDGKHLHVTPPRVASSLRYLLARLQLGGAGGLPGRVALTAALRGEGVSYIARSLAAVVAYDSEASVAVVDLNWRNPPVGDADGEADEAARPTLADAVEHDLDVTDIITPTTNPRLSLVAAGAIARHRRPAMAGSRSLQDVIDKLGEHFDHLVLDLPPILASSDAITLSRLADGVLVVVQQGVTSSAQVEQALDELGTREALGVIFNRFDSSIPVRLRKMVGG